MKATRPQIEQAQLDSFIRQGVQGAEPYTTPKSTLETTQSPLVGTTPDNHAASDQYGVNSNQEARRHKAVAKFLVEMPPDLRRSIKYRSIDCGKSMNDMIIDCLQERFGHRPVNP